MVIFSEDMYAKIWYLKFIACHIYILKNCGERQLKITMQKNFLLKYLEIPRKLVIFGCPF